MLTEDSVLVVPVSLSTTLSEPISRQPEGEVHARADPKGKHEPDRETTRWTKQRGDVGLPGKNPPAQPASDHQTANEPAHHPEPPRYPPS